MQFSKKAVVWKILTLYLMTSGIFVIIISNALYQKQKELLIEKKSLNIKEARSFIARNLNKYKLNNLKEISKDLNVKLYIRQKNNIIFSNFNPPKEILLKKGLFIYENIIYIHTRLPKSKNTGILLKGDDILPYLQKIQQKFIIFGFVVFVLIILVAYFLVKLSLKPLLENIKFLNRFIKDSTHEINAPLSIILMSIESMQTQDLSPKNQKRINNINLAAKTLSNIYNDLTYISFNDIKNKNEILNLAQILQERINFFTPLFQIQNLQVNSNLQNSTLKIDALKLQKMLDNLLSNIAKFASKNSEVSINLSTNSLMLSNKTDDILPSNLNKIFQSYERFNQNKGGFGIGLSIVKQICDEFDIKIDVKFKNQQLILTLIWQNPQQKPNSRLNQM